MNSQRGMTLLEAVVALALMAMGAMALFDWMGGNAIALQRAQARASALSLERSALALMEPVNPLVEPRGRRVVDSLEVSWTSRPIQGPVIGRGVGGPPSVFDLTLFELEVTFRGASMREPRQFKVRKTGWITARSMELPE